jgi:eukaryotic-like serine/threonine-protein kinase
MAAVWCADDLVLGRAVAVKVLAERFAHDDMAMRRFKREARAAARVSTHAHVVTIYDVGDLDVDPRDVESSARPFIVMEYLAGGTVADAIRVGAVRRQEAVRWIREAGSALDHAHARGIVHRDIKPANFLLNRSRVLHVADFGIARLVSEDTITSTGELFGTAAYLSPEQALGREATGASDRYALAVAAFELLAGERPFDAPHFAAQARQHIEDERPQASERDRTLPPATDAVLMRGMAKEPDERFETAGDFVNALETALSGGIAVTDQRTTAPRRRTRTPFVGAASLGAPGNGRSDGRTDGRAGGIGRAETVSRWQRPTHSQAQRSTGGTGSWTAASTIQRGSTGRRRTGRLLALVALVVVIGAAGALALAGLGGSRRPVTHAAIKPSHTPGTRTRVAAAAKPKPAATPPAPPPARSATSSAPAPPTPPSAQQLQLTGHNEMIAGNYPQAITTLRKAVSAADPSSLTYAYGLYDLGVALLKSGDAASAVPVLEQRLKIPNQTAVVQQTLNEALQATGQAPPQTHGHGHGKGRGHGHDGGGAGGPGPSGGAGLTGPGSGGGDDEHSNFVD